MSLHFKAQGETSPPAYAIVINLPAFRLYLYRDGELWHDYPVAIGKPITPTPVGEYSLVCKVHDPVWYPEGKKPVPPGPENPLGRWWLGLSVDGYGIHGCLDESSIGKAVSNGCLRLHNRDVAQLVECVGVGTPVRIVYELFALREEVETGRVWLWAGQDIYRYSGADAAERYLTETATLPWEREAARAVLAGRIYLRAGWRYPSRSRSSAASNWSAWHTCWMGSSGSRGVWPESCPAGRRWRSRARM